MEKLLNYRTGESSPGDELRGTCEKMRQEKQEEAILKLQATVEAQGEILKTIADRLKITD